MTIKRLSLVITLALWACPSHATDIQVLVQADKIEYAFGEPIKLSYRATWLGPSDGHIRFSSKGFPRLEVLYQNRVPVEIVKTGESTLSDGPSRHEKAVFAPTMERISKRFTINDISHPIDFLDGTQGYYNFNRPGTYVIRATFASDTDWRLFDEQKGVVRSNALVVRVGSKSGVEYSDLLKSIRTEFQASNPDIQIVQILDSKPKHTDYWIVARGIIDPADFRGSFEDELFGVFVVDQTYSRVKNVIDILPTPRWHDYIVWISDYDIQGATIMGHGATYKDNPLEKHYEGR